MVVYSFYIFDRHTECIYSRKWEPQTAPPGSSSGNSTTTSTSAAATKHSSLTRPQSSASTIGPADHHLSQHPSQAPTTQNTDSTKLLFGTIFSLRNIVTKLGGPDDSFLSYRTDRYKLHYYETPTRLKFCMLTDPAANNLRLVLHQIWATLYVEFVVKNPLAPVEHKGGEGVRNEAFEGGLERFMESLGMLG